MINGVPNVPPRVWMTEGRRNPGRARRRQTTIPYLTHREKEGGRGRKREEEGGRGKSKVFVSGRVGSNSP